MRRLERGRPFESKPKEKKHKISRRLVPRRRHNLKNAANDNPPEITLKPGRRSIIRWLRKSGIDKSNGTNIEKLKLSKDVVMLSDKEYPHHAADHVIELSGELADAINKGERDIQIEKFADIFQILMDLTEQRGYTQEQIENVKRANQEAPALLHTLTDKNSRYFPADIIVDEIQRANTAFFTYENDPKLLVKNPEIGITHLLNTGLAVHNLMAEAGISEEEIDAKRIKMLTEFGDYSRGYAVNL